MGVDELKMQKKVFKYITDAYDLAPWEIMDKDFIEIIYDFIVNKENEKV